MEQIHTFGLWVRQRRRALDLTQQQLAQRVGCSVVTIRKIEAEERRPSRQIAELLADSLEVPARDRAFFLKFARSGYSAEPALENIVTAGQSLDTGTAAAPSVSIPRPAALQGTAPKRPVEVQVRGQTLPVQHTPFIGREHELEEIDRLLESSECRLLTLIGPAGIGKTRLALQAARQMVVQQAELFAEGVYFVSFASISSPAFMIPTLAEAIGLAFYGSHDPRLQLLNYLENKNLLLVIDNLEHLLPSAGQSSNPSEGGDAASWGDELLSDILQHAPGVKLLVTSRERLNLRGEWLLDIHALPYPEAGREESFERYSAVALFLQTARRVAPGFALTAEERPWVAQVCRLVEGIPLGIEMAASWVRVLSCQEIAQEIERNLDFLATSLRDVPERHRSMRAAFDHSWNLLSPDEQAVFRKLSVFQGGFTRESAAQVASASLLGLSALVDKSLLRHSDAGRYSFHELLHQYASAKLQEAPQEQQLTLLNYCGYFTRMLSERDATLRSALQPQTIAGLKSELDNLRPAWQTALHLRCWSALRRSTRALSYFYETSGLILEGEEIFRTACQALGEAQESGGDEEQAVASVQMRTHLGYFNYRCGNYTEAKKLLLRSLAELRALDAPVELADAITFLGHVEAQMGEYAEARRLLQEGIAYNRANGYLWNTAVCLIALGLVSLRQGNYAEAQQTLDESLQILRQEGDPRLLVWALYALSSIHTARGEYSSAQEVLRESLTISYDLQDRWGTAAAQQSLGQVLFMQGQYTQAKYHLQDSLELFREIGDRLGMGYTLNLLGDTDCAQSDCEDARFYFYDALRTAIDIQTMPLAMDALVRLAGYMMKKGDPQRAFEILTRVVQHPATTREARDQAENMLAGLESRLTPQQKSAAQSPDKVLENLIQEILDAFV